MKIGALGVAPILFLAALSAFLLSRGARDTTQESDAIIVFGAKVNASGQASPMLRARTRQAFELWKLQIAPKIVCTGGVGEFAPAESAASAALLKRWGVPETAILVEENSTSTRENALEAAKLLPRGARVVAVSQPFHLWRCARELENVGFSVAQSPETESWNALRADQKLFLLLRECAVVCRDGWRFLGE